MPNQFFFDSVTGSSFQIGYTFYYWDDYKSDELYVERKYESFKDEIREYQYLSVKHYKELVTKVMKFMNTIKVKQLKARIVGAYEYFDELNYMSENAN